MIKLSIIKKINIAFSWRLNKLIFRQKNIYFGENFKVLGKIYLETTSTSLIKIGDNFLFLSGYNFNPLTTNRFGCIVVTENAEIIIGNNCGLSSTILWARKSIKIGNHVNIGGDTMIMDSNAHSLDYLKRRNFFLDQQNRIDEGIVIEDDVLIGARCVILKGVHIGARSIIGAGSVVVKSIPPDCLAAGNPAKVIKKLNIV